MDEYIFSLDIGSSKVCAAAGRLERTGKVQIIGVTTVPCTGVKKGIVVDIDSTAKAIGNCVEQLKKMIDRDIANVFISLPGGISELVSSKGVVAVSSEDREINSGDIKRVLTAAQLISVPNDKEVIGIIPIQYVIDGYDNIKDPVGMSGTKLEVEAMVILSQTTIVSNLIKSVQKAGLSVKGIVLEPIAIAQAVLKKDELSLDMAILDVGLEKLDIAIYKDGNLSHIETIPIGGNAITNDISICLKIPFSEAEKLKIKYGSVGKEGLIGNETVKVTISYNDYANVDISTLLAIMDARIEEILTMVNDRLINCGYCENISGIILVGGGIAPYKDICKIGRNIFSVPVRIGTPDYVGAANPVFNTTIGIIKDIYLNSNIKELNKNHEMNYESSKIHNKEIRKAKDESVLTKIKVFLSDFF